MAKDNGTNGNGANLGFEADLWRAADALRSGMDAAEYKHVVLGLIFLKYISDGYLDSLGLHAASYPPEQGALLDSLLATADDNAGTDWTERPPLQARMKVAIRRLLIGFGIAGPNAETTAEHVVGWLRKQLTGVDRNGGISNE